MTESTTERFIEAAKKVGAEVTRCSGLADVASYVSGKAKGHVLVPETPLAVKHQLRDLLQTQGIDVFTGPFREAGLVPGGGVTFSNFAMADSGTVVLESTDENIRFATTIPEVHFIIVDPETILKDNLEAAAPMTEMHTGHEARFVAYITGPSRTADIERVLTIGCHGPRELHILIVDGVSSDLMEN